MFDILVISEIESMEFGAGGVRPNIRYAVMYFRFKNEAALKILIAGNSIRNIPSSSIIEKGTLIPPDGPIPKSGNEITSVDTLDEAIQVARQARANPDGFLALKNFAPTTQVFFINRNLVSKPMNIDD